ncbi:phage tail protein [Castellaniella caeni]|uniref:phage tail protein n=1 Tax=Castellaniella caeni TaxID=266123 RepID=UPI000C9EC7D2|nr:phage tail protein [Castellaniella caeni]
MALEEYKGSIVLDINGQEVDVVDLQVTERTGKKPVRTMNRALRVKGFTRGLTEYELRVTVAIPLSGDIDWAGIEGAKITEFPVSDDGNRTSYLDCVTTEVGETYNVEGEARRDISMFAARKVIE